MRKTTFCAIIASNRMNDLLDRSLNGVLVTAPDQIILVNDSGQPWAAPPNVEVIHTEGNIGLSAARNLALDQACADYVLFCDDDDLWRADKLDILDAEIAQMRHRFIVHDSIIFDITENVEVGRITGDRLRRFKVAGRWLWLNYLVYSMPVSNSSCWCIRADILADFRFDPNVQRGVDGTFWYFFLNRFRTAPHWIAKALTEYGINHPYDRITSQTDQSKTRKSVGDALNRGRLHKFFFAPVLLKWWIDDWWS